MSEFQKFAISFIKVMLNVLVLLCVVYNIVDNFYFIWNQYFNFVDCGLRVVGSSVNGLGTNSSDADMCLILSTREVRFGFSYLVMFWLVFHKIKFVLSFHRLTSKLKLCIF